MTKLLVGAFVALLSPCVAQAAPQAREPVSLAVSTVGLDLGTPQGMRAMNARIARAVSLACDPSDRLRSKYSPDWQCRRELVSDADAKVAALLRARPAVYVSTTPLGRGTE